MEILFNYFYGLSSNKLDLDPWSLQNMDFIVMKDSLKIEGVLPKQDINEFPNYAHARYRIHDFHELWAYEATPDSGSLKTALNKTPVVIYIHRYGDINSIVESGSYNGEVETVSGLSGSNVWHYVVAVDFTDEYIECMNSFAIDRGTHGFFKLSWDNYEVWMKHALYPYIHKDHYDYSVSKLDPKCVAKVFPRLNPNVDDNEIGPYMHDEHIYIYGDAQVQSGKTFTIPAGKTVFFETGVPADSTNWGTYSDRSEIIAQSSSILKAESNTTFRSILDDASQGSWGTIWVKPGAELNVDGRENITIKDA
jgi:hypothetical protein